MPRHLVYFVHADATVRASYAAALAPAGDVDLIFVAAQGLSSAYDRLAGTLRDEEGRVLPGLRARFPAPRPADEYVSTSLITFSAGYALARALFAHPVDRDELAGYVAIDSIHAGFVPKQGTTFVEAELEGFAAFAEAAKAGAAVFWVGHSDVPTPQPPERGAYGSTTQTAAELVRIAGGTGGGFEVRSFNVRYGARAEHVAALTEWGPSFAAEALVPCLRARGLGEDT